MLSKHLMTADNSTKKRYSTKEMHRYYGRKVSSDAKIDKHLSNYWRKDKFIMPEIEKYLSTIHHQELHTKYLKHKRARDIGITSDYNNKCRFCVYSVEDINHIISSCTHMSSRYFLPLKHDKVVKKHICKYVTWKI